MFKPLLNSVNYKGESCACYDDPLMGCADAFEYEGKLSSLSFYLMGLKADWIIRDGGLFLLDLRVKDKEKEAQLKDRIFKAEKEVFAAWYSGDLRLRSREPESWTHLPYSSDFPIVTVLKIKEGRVLEDQTTDNFAQMDEFEKQEALKQGLNLYYHSLPWTVRLKQKFQKNKPDYED